MMLVEMPVSRVEAVALFPTSGPLREELQIGRGQAIESITAAAAGGATLICAEDRHLGKSSLLLAMTDRVLRHASERMALSVDLRDGVASSQALAATLLTQADKQDAGARIKAMIVKGKLRKLAPASLTGLGAAGALLGEQDDLAAAQRLITQLTPAQATIRRALLALDAHGHATGQRTIVVLDEAQDIAGWPDTLAVQREIAATIKRPASTVNFVLSGSEKHTLLALYDDTDAPLHGLGMRFELPEISWDDWCAGLAARFAQASIMIAPKQLQEIVYHSDRHPLRTMLICSHTLDWLVDDGVTHQTVARAIAAAERHPSWSAP